MFAAFTYFSGMGLVNKLMTQDDAHVIKNKIIPK